MEKLTYIVAYDGTEVIEATEESRNRANDLNYLFERKEREQRFTRNHKSMFRKLAAMCGIL